MKRELVAKCSEMFDVHPRDLLGPARFGFLIPARFALYKAMRIRGWSFAQIGRFMNRDHSTVIHGVARAEYIMARDEQYREKVQELVEFRIAPIEQDETVDADV